MSVNITPKTIRKLNRDHAGDYVIMVVLGLFAVLTFYPMWYVVVGSFSEGADYMKGGVYFFPRVFTLENYKVIVSSQAVWRSIGVTVARCALGPTISVLFTAFVAYGMSRKELRFKKLFNFAGIFTMFFSGGLIPYYLLCKILGFINNFFVYIIPGAYSVYNMILIRSFFKNMPEELHEATVLDGASRIPHILQVYDTAVHAHTHDNIFVVARRALERLPYLDAVSSHRNAPPYSSVRSAKDNQQRGRLVRLVARNVKHRHERIDFVRGNGVRYDPDARYVSVHAKTFCFRYLRRLAQRLTENYKSKKRSII